MKLPVFSATAFATVMALGGTAYSQDLFIDGDMVRGAKDGAPGGAVIDFNPDGAAVCVLTNQFKHLEKVVFRFRVRDQSGKMLDKDSLKSLVIEVPNGEKLPANYGPHPPLGPTDYFWTVVWVVPASYPSGTLTYKAIATDMAGQEQSWGPINRVPSQLQVLPDEISVKP
jgi:hypothetical protein